jgi:hypothetical protein
MDPTATDRGRSDDVIERTFQRLARSSEEIAACQR